MHTSQHAHTHTHAHTSLQELPELWALHLLLPAIGKRLAFSASIELVPLMEILGVKQVLLHCHTHSSHILTLTHKHLYVTHLLYETKYLV